MEKSISGTGLLGIIFLSILISFSGCTSSAEAVEFYEIGMAYFELGRYEEAEKWLIRAKNSDRTLQASQYNLGRLAFERQRYEEASRYFEDVLKRDDENILALRAAAFSRIRAGDLSSAEKHYTKLFELVPDHIDDGYNHALVLFALGRANEAEAVLGRFPAALNDNSDVILLNARILAAGNKVEAVNYYSNWLSSNTDPKIRFEFAQVLEKHDLLARALEEYRRALAEVPASASNLNKSDFYFAIARVLLIAENASSDGITELQNAVSEGFNDIPALEELANNRRISASNRERVRNILNEVRRAN